MREESLQPSSAGSGTPRGQQWAPDRALLAATVLFVLVAFLDSFRQYGQPPLYTILVVIHWHLSRYAFAVAPLMLAIAVYTGIIRKGDVTPWFRRGVYVITGTMVFQALLGVVMMFGMGGQPLDSVHLIYGAGAALALPFFVYVETTTSKRPAMGSYIWGFLLMIGILFRAISTGG